MKNNVEYICKDCSDERREAFQQSYNLNKDKYDRLISECLLKSRSLFVKFSFEDGDTTEHMWVKIREYDASSGTITGTLDNDPVQLKNV